MPIRLDGGSVGATIPDMIGAPAATLLFLRGERAGRPCWLALPADASGVSIAATALTDATRTLGTVTLDGVTVDEDALILAEDPAALDDHLLRVAAIAIAADAIGGGEAALAGTIDYMKVREQFGRVIGSFQALQHRVADHQAALVAARGLVEHAAGLPDDAPHALLDALSRSEEHTSELQYLMRNTS